MGKPVCRYVKMFPSLQWNFYWAPAVSPAYFRYQQGDKNLSVPWRFLMINGNIPWKYGPKYGTNVYNLTYLHFRILKFPLIWWYVVFFDVVALFLALFKAEFLRLSLAKNQHNPLSPEFVNLSTPTDCRMFHGRCRFLLANDVYFRTSWLPTGYLWHSHGSHGP